MPISDRAFWFRVSLAVLTLATVEVTILMAIGSCVGNKGVETGPIASPDKSSTTTADTDQGMHNSPGGRQTNIVFQAGFAGVAVLGIGLVGYIGWDRREAKKALRRAIMGIEACGPECDGKKFCRGFEDRTEHYLHKHVKRATKG